MASTSLPTDDGESDRVAALPTGLRPIEVGELAAQQLDGVAESPPELSAPVPANDEDGNALSTGVRLSDAERIASERLDGAAEGSLKEALAIAPAPRPAAFSLVERIELVDESLVAETVTPSFEPTTDVESSGQAPVLADGAEPSATTSTDGSDPIVPSEITAAASPLAADAVGTEAAVEVSPVSVVDAPPAAVAAPVREGGAPDNVRPLASALDAAARLAADANAAAEALANLQRLLERQLPNVAASPAAAASAEPEAVVPPTSATVAVAPTMAPRPPSLPLHAVRDGSGRTTLRPAMLAPLPPRHAGPERMRFDVRGFLAGFALSWAFGVVLYLYMTSG
jgi:hypothetical protein